MFFLKNSCVSLLLCSLVITNNVQFLILILILFFFINSWAEICEFKNRLHKYSNNVLLLGMFILNIPFGWSNPNRVPNPPAKIK